MDSFDSSEILYSPLQKRYPANCRCTERNLETDVVFIGGGGFIYGINNNFAVEFDDHQS
jgi:hypothetical protein